MKVKKAVITLAGESQRNLPLQTLVDRDGSEKAVLHILIEEVLRAQIDEICLVVRPGDATAYTKVADDHASCLHFVPQDQPLGYGHAIYCAREFVGDDPFLHLVGDPSKLRGTCGWVPAIPFQQTLSDMVHAEAN